MSGFRALILLLLILPFSQTRAAQTAIVIGEKAFVYADDQMTSPLGYLPRGKKIRIGEIARNKGQVYPTLISGKIAFIRAIDVSTETTGAQGPLIAERFAKTAEIKQQYTYSLNYLNFRSNISVKDINGGSIKNNDPIVWNGINLQGGVDISKRADTKIIFNYLQAKKGEEMMRVTELGLGFGLRLLNERRLILNWELDGLVIPYAQYRLGSLFRVNGYGFTAGTGLNANYRLGENWGLNGLLGYYYTRIMGLDLPGAYPDIEPTFTGIRLGLGISYRY